MTVDPHRVSQGEGCAITLRLCRSADGYILMRLLCEPLHSICSQDCPAGCLGIGRSGFSVISGNSVSYGAGNEPHPGAVRSLFKAGSCRVIRPRQAKRWGRRLINYVMEKELI